MEILQGCLGLTILVGIAWLISEDRRRFDMRILASGLVLQFALALLLLKIPMIQEGFLALNKVVELIESSTRAGTSFVFSYLGGGDLPFEATNPGATYIFAFRALPIILIMSALSAVLYYWRVLPLLVKGFTFMLRRTMGVGGVLGVSAAANIFMGMVEAPLLVRPYLKEMTRSELFAMMTCGMATIAGTMLVIYASILQNVLPGALGHILVASIISAPASILIARIMVPETGTPTSGVITPPQEYSGTMDAVVSGTTQGIQIYIPVVALLVVLVALVALVNSLLGMPGDIAGEPLTLQRIFSWVMAPLMWLIGIPWSEAPTAGSLMGTKVVLNEFLAYLNLAHLPEGTLSDRSELIMTYAMCGFANFGSLGIMIGGISALAPERRAEIVALGMRSILAGVLATCMTGAIVGILM